MASEKKSKKKEKKEKKDKKRDRGDDGGPESIDVVAAAADKRNEIVDDGAPGSSKRHKPASSSGGGSDEDDGGGGGGGSRRIEQQQQRQHHDTSAGAGSAAAVMPAAPTFDPLRDGDTTLAAFRAAKPPPRGPGALRACWPLEGASPAPRAPLPALAPERLAPAAGSAGRELWVVQLPAALDLGALDGATLRLDAGALAAAASGGDVGQIDIGSSAALDLGVVPAYALRQEAPAAASELFVAAPTRRAAGALEPLRPTRRLVLAEDAAAAAAALVAAAHDAAPSLQFYPQPMSSERANALLQEQGIFRGPPDAPEPGAWPPARWQPSDALKERDLRREARRKRGLPAVDPRDELEAAGLADLRPAPGAPWGVAGGAPLPPQWQQLPLPSLGRGGTAAVEALGDPERDVSVAYANA